MIQEDLWEVAIATPLRRTFVYRIPAGIGTAAPGKRALVPFGPRRVIGYLLGPWTEAPGAFAIKSAVSVLDDEPVLTGELLQFLLEAASYYLHSKGEAIKTALPPAFSRLGKNSSAPPGAVKTHRRYRPSKDLLENDIDAIADDLSKKAPARGRLLRDVVRLDGAFLSDLRKDHPRATELAKRLVLDGLLAFEDLQRHSDPFDGVKAQPLDKPELNAEQALAVQAIDEAVISDGYSGFLLHGVTGSGKTEVYFRAIERARERKKGALVLVPEISLTPQLVHRYRARFGDGLAVLHSGLTEKSRLERWHALREGHVQVAIGVRSAVFAPIHDLGLVIVDEEHDSSFKQERGFPYNGRDLALLRAARAGAVAVLGSATPSLETYNNWKQRKLTRLVLEQRATGTPLPRVVVLDLRRHHNGPMGQRLVTGPLFEAIQETLARDEQAILFLNRRGFSPAIVCDSCGETVQCSSCSVAMTFHTRPETLKCHYCGAKRGVPKKCLSCGKDEPLPLGAGTQKAEETLRTLFPTARIARMDRDSASGRKGERILEGLRNREIDILVGTQMVTKGHDFPFVTLVGVLNADVGLHMPDFRAAERTFQLLTQVAGRAGRSERGGLAYIQTYSANHPAILTASGHDYLAFVEGELQTRFELKYPPFGRAAAIRVSSPEEHKSEASARDLFVALKEIHASQGRPDIAFLGPAQAPLSQVKGRFRWHILLKSPRQDLIRGLLEPALPMIESPPSGVRIRLDIDPQSML